MAVINFNTNESEFNAGFDVFEAGNYQMVIESADIEKTKDGSGVLLKLVCVVAPGQANAGRKVTTRLNLWNQSQEAVKIARKELKNLGYATGLVNAANPVLTDTDQLKNRQVLAKVGIQGEWNVIKNWLMPDGSTPGAGMPTSGGAIPSGAQPAGFNPGAVQPPTMAANPFAAPNTVAAPAVPPAPPAPPAPSAPPPPVSFPPAGWQAHPSAPGYFWNSTTNAVVTEAELRAQAAPAPPAPVAASPNPFGAPPAGMVAPQGAPTGPNPFAAGFQPQAPAAAPAGWGQ